MKKKGASLPINVLVIVILVLIVLVVTVFAYSSITGKEIFPAITGYLKNALGMLKESRVSP